MVMVMSLLDKMVAAHEAAVGGGYDVKIVAGNLDGSIVDSIALCNVSTRNDTKFVSLEICLMYNIYHCGINSDGIIRLLTKDYGITDPTYKKIYCNMPKSYAEDVIGTLLQIER